MIHRDLTPSNIMLGEGDKLTISESEEREMWIRWPIFQLSVAALIES